MFAALLIFSSSKSQNLYSVQGDAYSLSAKEYVVTDNANFLQGAVWHNDPIDLSQDFWLIFELDFGCNMSGGGDGLAFVMQDVGIGLGPQGTGGNLGYNGINPSLVIEFDTFEGTTNGDPFFDHIAMNQNGDIDHGSPNNLAGPFPFDFTTPDVETCTYLNLAIQWDAVSKEISVFFCGNFPGYTVFSQVVDIPNTIFSGNSIVTFGFTGATEFSTNFQKFKHIGSSLDEFTNDTTICLGDSINFEPIPSNFSCQWEAGGSILSTQNNFTTTPSGQTTYTLTMTDNCSGIQKIETFTVFVDSAIISETISSHIDVACFGEANGQLEVTLNGTNPLFSIDGNPTQSNGLFSALTASSYELIGFNDEGCSDTININIIEPNDLNVQIDAIGDVPCNTSSTGFIEITPIGGTPPYQVVWTDEDNIDYVSEDIYNISEGEYDLTITDNNGCVFVDMVTVVQLNNISSTLLATNPSCYQANDGSINPIVSGGTTPYSYEWNYQGSFFSNSQNISNLSPGLYNLVVTDVNNCYKSFDTVITQPNEFLVSANTYDVSCYQAQDGALSSTFTGGTNPYTSFFLDETQQFLSSQDSIGNLPSEQFYLYGTDLNGCFSDTLLLTVNEPNSISVTSTDFKNLVCNNIPTGLISVEANGGSGVFTSYQWSGPNGFSEMGETIDQLYAGTYQLTVTDDNNCIESVNYTIDQPTLISTSTSNIGYVKCKGSNSGSITVSSVGGTPPYNYDWSGVNGFNSTGSSIDSLFQGDYTVQVTDDNGCLTSSTFTVYEPDSILQFNVDATNSCLNEPIGTATLNILGGVPPYAIDWLGNDPLALPTGQYSVLVRDNADCEVEENYSIDMFSLPEATFEVDSIVKVGSVVALGNQSTADISWYWEFGNGINSDKESPTVIYEYQDDYTITLTVYNTYGCSDTTSATIYATNDLTLYIPNSFTPNDDRKNELFNVSISNNRTFEIAIFNKFSELLFRSTDDSMGWDGNYKGKPIQSDIYIVYVYATDLFGKVYEQRKTIHLIR